MPLKRDVHLNNRKVKKMSKDQHVMKKLQIKKRKTYDLRLTKYELLHLRDLFSVSLPPGDKTLSQSLAETESRPMVETSLWSKVSEACSNAGLPLGDEAPDYVVASIETPALGVFQIASEPEAQDDDEDDVSNVFDQE